MLDPDENDMSDKLLVFILLLIGICVAAGAQAIP